MSGKLSLLDDSSDSEIELTVNKDYANTYNHWRNKEELQKYKDLKKEDDESESSSESEEEAPEFDEEFFRALSLLKGKDPRIYDKNFELFKKKELAPKPKTEKKKPMFMKDYERTLVLERGGKFSDEEEEDDLADKVPTYSEEQEDLKKSFKEAFKDSDDSDADDLLQVRAKTKKEQEEEEVNYIKWLKGEEKEISEDVKKDMSYLRSYWNDPELDEGEKFLRDYILNKKYLEKDDSEIPTYEEITSGMLSDDEKMIEEQEKFEHKYNFRFEEPDEEFIKRYPRTIGDSLRRADTRRKQKRDEKIERKRQEREQRKEELKRLKALKRKEIEEKFMKLKEISGQDEINLNESDMESDFDPDKHDQKMRDMFNDEYYQVEEDQKPEFPYDEELDAENWNAWAGEKIVDDEDESESAQEENIEDIQDEKPTTSRAKNDFANEMINASRPKKRVKKKSLFAKIVSQSKPVYDPEGKSFEEYLDEYYKLDYEDIVGDMPVRYKYRKVIPNDFGLTVDEILAADDKELNRWCSVKKTCQYRNDEEELYDVQAFQKKGENPVIKKKILQSVYAPKDEDSATEDFKLKQHGEDISSFDNSSKAFRKKGDCLTDGSKEKGNDSHKISVCNSTEDEVSDFAQDAVSDNKPSKVQQAVDEQNFSAHTSKKKKKKQKHNLDPQGEPVKLKGVNGTSNVELSNSSEENQKIAKRKRGHDNDDDSVNSSPEVSETITGASIGSEDPVIKTSKKKKKQKQNSGAQEESERLEDVNRTSSNELSNLSEENQKSGKRKRDHDDDDSEDSNAEVSETVTSTSNTVSEDPVAKTSKKKKKKRKKKHVSQDTSNSNVTVTQSNKSNSHDKKFKNKSKNSTSESINNLLGLSDARLAAYGINPKKFKNKMKYAKV